MITSVPGSLIGSLPLWLYAFKNGLPTSSSPRQVGHSYATRVWCGLAWCRLVMVLKIILRKFAMLFSLFQCSIVLQTNCKRWYFLGAELSCRHTMLL